MLVNRDYTYSIPWNCFLIISGSLLYAIGLKAIAEPHGFLPGALFGLAWVVHFMTDFLNTGTLFILLNIPLFILGRYMVSVRFLLYSLLAMIIMALSYMFFQIEFDIVNQLYAAIACGVLCGAGSGMVLRSLGSNGGLDIVAIILYQRFNIGVGKLYFVFNFLLFSAGFLVMETDLVLASIIMVFVTSAAMEYSFSIFNQRKMVLIISDHTEIIADVVMARLKISSTFLNGVGAYTKANRKIMMTIINNIQLKRLEQIVFENDDKAMFIVENTFNVIGSSFAKRKIY